MAWDNLISAVNAAITTNGNNEITGQVLRELLVNNLIPQIGESSFKGLATPTTNPGAQDGKVFYLAFEVGSYANFNAVNIEKKGLYYITNNTGSWVLHTIWEGILDDLEHRLIENDKQYAENAIIDDTFENTTGWSKVSGAGTLTFPILNNKKVLYANDCVVDFVIPVSAIDVAKTWAFGVFVENSVLASGLRIAAQGQVTETGSSVGTKYDYTIPIGDSGKKLTLLSDGYTLDPTANFLRIIIIATGNQIWLSNPFLGNAPRGMFKSVDLAKRLAENGNDYLNLIPDNIFQKDVSYFQNTQIYGQNNVLIQKAQFDNDYSKFSLKATAQDPILTNNWIGIYHDITSIIREGDTLRFKALVFPTVSGTYLERRFRDVNNVTIQSLSNINLIQNEWNYIDFEATVPADTAYANFFVRNFGENEVVYLTAFDLHKKNTIPKHKITNPVSNSNSNYNVVEIDVNGDDLNSGAIGSPVATFGKAIELVGNFMFPKLIVRQGDCRETIDFNSFGSSCIKPTIITPTGEVARILGSKKIESFAKTSGYTNVYEATVTDAIAVHGTHLNKRILFEDGNPSKAILDAERHPLQKGLTHRLPYTELIEVDFDTDLATTLTNLDAEANGGIYYDTANDKMYIVTSNQTNPSSNGFSYEYANRPCTISPDLNKYLNIEVDNLQFCFSSGLGADFSNFNKVERTNCRVFGARDNGFQDDSNILISYNEESAGCGNDGQNGHYNGFPNWDSTDTRTGNNQAIYHNSWSHDNYDDGMSHHERGELTTYGGLYEYNWDRGIAPSNTCKAIINNPYVRKSGQAVGIDVGATGIGISVVNIPIGSDERKSASAVVYGGVVEENTIGAGVQSTGNLLKLVGTILRENTAFNLSASFGKIIADNCKSTQSSGNHKQTLNGGVIEVITDANLI